LTIPSDRSIAPHLGIIASSAGQRFDPHPVKFRSALTLDNADAVAVTSIGQLTGHAGSETNPFINTDSSVARMRL
jgi:hypothetical protein